MSGKKMLIDLKDLRPNPQRDFRIDPIDMEAVAALQQSIQDDGFWGGVTARKNGEGTYQIACGHHRIEAAKLAGMTVADIFVGDFDDQQMVRVYSRENATQRSGKVTAVNGSVAAAVRYVARMLLTGRESVEFNRLELFDSKGSFEIAFALFLKDGIGRDVITRVLKGIPGITTNTVNNSLSQIKSSGDYARIVQEVQTQIAAEAEKSRLAAAEAERKQQEAEAEAALRQQELVEARKRAAEAKEKAAIAKAEKETKMREEMDRLANERMQQAKEELDQAMAEFVTKQQQSESADKAATHAAEQEITFDLEGVQAFLKNTHQLNVFKDLVESPGVKPYLPVTGQAALAKALVEQAKTNKVELTGAFIRENLVFLLTGAKRAERTFSKKEKEALRNQDVVRKANAIQEEMARAMRNFNGACVKLFDLLETFPKEVPFPLNPTLTRELPAHAILIERLNQELPTHA